jgi:hypothetical protein
MSLLIMSIFVHPDGLKNPKSTITKGEAYKTKQNM